MHKIDGKNATEDGRFQEYDPATGQGATYITASWLNAVQGELIAILEAQGIEPSKASSAQVLAALDSRFTSQADLSATGGAALVGYQGGTVSDALANLAQDLLNGLSGGAPLYADTTAGLAATSEGGYFNVPSSEPTEIYIVYRHDAGPVATELGRTPSSEPVLKNTRVLRNSERINVSPNLISPEDQSEGFVLNPTNGSTNGDGSWTTSGFFEVVAGAEYRKNNASTTCFYDAEKVFLSSSEGSIVTAPPGSVYARIEYLIGELGFCSLRSNWPEGGGTPYEDGASIPDLVYDPEKIVESVSRADGFDPVLLDRRSPNLIDRDAAGVLHSTYIDAGSGAFLLSDSFYVTDFIAVAEGESYALAAGRPLNWYDASLALISTVSGQVVIAPPNAAFARVTVAYNQDYYATMLQGDVPTSANSYIPYRLYRLAEDIRPTLPWAGLKWNVMGDSITEASYAYHRPLWRELGFSCVRNYGIGGTSIAVRDAPWDTNAMCVRYADMDDDADLITVMGGTNDVGGTLGSLGNGDNTTFYGALEQLCDGLTQKYPDKIIAFFTLPQRAQIDYAGGSTFDFADATLRVCERWGIPVLDVLRDVPLRTHNADFRAKYFANGEHPNEEGHKLIAARMRGFLEGLVWKDGPAP